MSIWGLFGFNKPDTKIESKELLLEEYKNTPEYKEELRQAAIEALREDKEKRQREERERKQQHQADVEKAEKDLSLLKEKMKDSPEPWVYIVGSHLDPSKGIEVSLEWNDSFIRYLRAQGVPGENDEEVVRMWLAHLSQDIDRQMIAEDYLYSDTPPEDEFEGNMQELIQYDSKEEEFDNRRK
jgi:hypothetical protein